MTTDERLLALESAMERLAKQLADLCDKVEYIAKQTGTYLSESQGDKNG